MALPHLLTRLSALQMKGRWESNINVWFPFMYSQKWNCYFQNRIIFICLPVHRLIYLWEIYIFQGSVFLFCCRKICGPIWEYKNRSQTHKCGDWDWGLAIPRKGYINEIYVSVRIWKWLDIEEGTCHFCCSIKFKCSKFVKICSLIMALGSTKLICNMSFHGPSVSKVCNS